MIVILVVHFSLKFSYADYMVNVMQWSRDVQHFQQKSKDQEKEREQPDTCNTEMISCHICLVSWIKKRPLNLYR